MCSTVLKDTLSNYAVLGDGEEVEINEFFTRPYV